MYDKDLQNHKKSDSKKWIITLVAFVLVFVLIGGICFAIFGGKSGEKTFNVNMEAYMELEKEDFEDSVPVTMASFMGTETLATNEDEEEPFAYIHLISYDESTKELIVIAAKNPYSDEETAALCMFVRAKNFDKDEVAELTKSESIWQDYFINREYEALLYFMDTSGDEPKGGWINMAILYRYEEILSGTAEDLEQYMVPTPSAKLKYKTEGTLKPSNNIMKILTGKKVK